MALWIDAHDASLKNYVQAGNLSYAEMATAINREFNTSYSRNSCIGRASRLGCGSKRKVQIKKSSPCRKGIGPMVQKINRARETKKSAFEVHPLVELRVVNLVPRCIGIADLDHGLCKYPFGGDKDGEAITFCGHPAMDDKPYCAPHFHLCRGPGTTSERRATHGIAA